MGIRGSLVRKEKRSDKLHPIFVIDFRYRDPEGRERRYRRDARLQTAAGARKEAERLYTVALDTGSVEIRSDAPTFGAFVEGTFTRLYMPRYRPATRKRYEELLGQGILATFGTKRLDAIGTTTLRAFVAELHGRPCSRVARSISSARSCARPLRAARSKRCRSFRSCPVGSEAAGCAEHRRSARDAALAKGWLRVAIALAAYAGLRRARFARSRCATST